MSDFETERAGLPVLIGEARPRPSLKRSETTAAFISQLIIGRERTAGQRERRRGPSEGAIGAYARSARNSERRLPPGYRTTILA
ncbi:hypothetical protein WH87_14835 [Devosia epidermidihirudinis]|uniref:Uncharacterized protein n=1 Tax=Devosia epidermidihirudinis TaxID=1293439 RepID=A0A0F5Q4J3_9HYPH|nr:hypothetical protein [Devosia epidermidihirudinis]KKC35848.1 hypothetical protein WH87_14835 [Devosia epidermidihirudinis]